MNKNFQLFTRKSTEYPDLETTFLDGSFRKAVTLQYSVIGTYHTDRETIFCTR